MAYKVSITFLKYIYFFYTEFWNNSYIRHTTSVCIYIIWSIICEIGYGVYQHFRLDIYDYKKNDDYIGMNNDTQKRKKKRKRSIQK